MKPKLISLATVLLLAGCATLNPSQVSALARAAGTAAKYAAQLDTGHRVQYVQVKAGLDELIKREAWDTDSLQLALTEMPDVSDPNIALYLGGGFFVYDLLTKVFFRVDTSVAVKAFAIELRDGIAVGLASSAPATAKAGPPEKYPVVPRPPRPLQKAKSL